MALSELESFQPRDDELEAASSISPTERFHLAAETKSQLECLQVVSLSLFSELQRSAWSFPSLAWPWRHLILETHDYLFLQL